ncbi:hypothetical protein G9F32_03160 [Acinetobacter sp. 194]|uniref:hypothetical protein n=1 Tax=Acinetobacter shaoyimingii TaxID=2715164 RepID=UPI00140E4ACB|nr:hypothetical protein [Acinetobacter shaoyimingii]NHB57032.1 hypothetical protein [Acinetobacter shaoyimingii]
MEIQTEYGEVHVLINCPLLSSTERLEFMTDVHQYFYGDEDREILRDAPRQVLSFNYIQFRKEMGDMFHMIEANIDHKWGIPLRHIKIKNITLNNDDFIQIDTTKTITDLKNGYVLVQTKSSNQVAKIVGIGRWVIVQEQIIDPDTNEVIQEEVTEFQDGFKLSEKLTVSDASIMPLKICIIDGDVTVGSGGFWSNTTFKFNVLASDSPEHEAEQPFQYENEDVYFMPLLKDGSTLEISMSRNQVLVDNEIGEFVSFSHSSKPFQTKPLKCIFHNADEFLEFRRFLFRRMGRYRAFWMPLYEKHINFTNTGNITTSLDVDNLYLKEADRNHIAVKRKNGTWTTHKITAKTAAKLYVTPSIAADRSDIESICYLGLYRFDTDHIEFQFLGAGKTQTTILIKELLS